MIELFWKGKIKLWKSYWIIGELFNGIFMLLIFNIEIYLFNNENLVPQLPFLNFTDFNIFSKLILIVWTLFITIGIWRAAENYKGNIIWIIATFLFLSYRIFSFRLIFFS